MGDRWTFVGVLPESSYIHTVHSGQRNQEQAKAFIEQIKGNSDGQAPFFESDVGPIPMIDRPEFVLTTAYPQYAAESYDFSALDYLTKPIAFERFMETVVRFRKKKTLYNQSSWELVNPHTPGEVVWLKDGKRILQIPNGEISHVEGWKDYVKVYYKDKMLLTHLNLGQAEAVFQPPVFVRIHRSYIIRVAAIRIIDGNEIELSNGIKLDIGQKYREEVKKYIPYLR